MTNVCRTIFLVTLVVTCGCGRESQESPPVDEPVAEVQTNETIPEIELELSPNGRSYRHAPSQTEFRVPSDWHLSPPATTNRVTSLNLQQGDDIVVTITWSPIRAELVEVVSSEMHAFIDRYGDSNVGLLEQTSTGTQSGWKLQLTSDAQEEDSRRGTVYWFAVNSPAGIRWKIKLRATYTRDADNEQIDRLLGQFEWTDREYGPRPEKL